MRPDAWPSCRCHCCCCRLATRFAAPFLPLPASLRCSHALHTRFLTPPCRQVKSATAESALPDFDFERKVGGCCLPCCPAVPAPSLDSSAACERQVDCRSSLTAAAAAAAISPVLRTNCCPLACCTGWPQDCPAEVPALCGALRGGCGRWACPFPWALVCTATVPAVRCPGEHATRPVVMQTYPHSPLQTLTARCRAPRCAPSCLTTCAPPAPATTAASGRCRWASASLWR